MNTKTSAADPAVGPLRDFLEIPYDQLEEMNLEAKEQRREPRSRRTRSARSGCSTCTDEKRIKAVTVCFTDLEGRLHMLDYDKKFLLKSADNLTFDGSSIRGFSQQARVRPAPGDRLAGVLLAALRRLRPRQGAGVRRGARARRHALRGRHARPAQGATPSSSSRRTARSATRPTRSRASSSRAATPSATTTRPATSSSSPPAATTTRCPATRCARFIDTRGRGAARDGLREREGPPRGGALAVRDELLATPRRTIAADQMQLYKLLCRQVAAQHGHDRLLPAQAGHRRQRQRHAHQHVARRKTARTCSTTRRAQDGLSHAGLGLHRPHPRQRATTSA